ncbi:asparaginase [Geodermatophilus sp. DSM 45219]|uniref:asparaginase n=1 Tax=Geodermatophilus sp. DSM 45219 TaxID=1881103 RepID=UPI000886E83A|nr:asparaginase [Geodermatophilus sp. DSM 45219]SDO22975.1 asparaginase [Geodermatophilus sp. DSM 45219]
MPLVRVLTTGGTIASRPDPDGRVVAADSGDDLLRALLPIEDVDVRVEDVFRLGSYRLGLDDVRELARRVRAAAADADGVVVTHGTDTMEETAWFLDLAHGGPQPVVVTGAQRNAEATDADGPRNLRDAVRLACDPAARDIGVVVAMAGRVLSARQVTKVHSLAVDAFAAPDGGQLGRVDAEAVRLVAVPRRRPAFDLDALDGEWPRVDVVPLHLGADGTFVRAAREAGARGIVLDAFGAGNVTPAVLSETEKALADGLLVLVTSRCHAGSVSPVYGAGGGADLAAAGALLAGDLRAPKARLLLTLALAAGGDADRAAEVLQPYVNP